MSQCIGCGRYTKYINGKCLPCYKKSNSKAGYVYLGYSKRRDGSRKLYTGQTSRSVYTRVGEHIKSVKNKNTKTWVGRGSDFSLLGAFFSRNRRKAEKTVKHMRPEQKIKLAKSSAKKYKRRFIWQH